MIRLALARGSRVLLMAPQPWDKQPTPPEGDKKASTTYEAVGRALTQWEYLETKLAQVFAVLVGEHWDTTEPPYSPAIRAYGAIVGAAARLTMIEEAANGFFNVRPDPDLKKKLFDFIGECRHFAGQRNNIAHGIVDLRFTPRAKSKKSFGHYLVPSFYGAKKNPIGGPQGYGYTSVEISYFAKQFDILWVRADELENALIRLSFA